MHFTRDVIDINCRSHFLSGPIECLFGSTFDVRSCFLVLSLIFRLLVSFAMPEMTDGMRLESKSR
jgi:hypothetical protein